MKIPADGKIHPETVHHGRCVWINKDGKTVAILCERGHEGKKNAVFLVNINSEK